MNKEAIVKLSEDAKRFELHIGDKLKAYTTELTDEAKKELAKLAEEKGYKIKHI